MDPSGLNSTTPCASLQLFSPNNVIYGKAGAANNWAKGNYGEGAKLIDNTVEVIRYEAEACDLVQGKILNI